jgi:hypothetical protein
MTTSKATNSAILGTLRLFMIFPIQWSVSSVWSKRVGS